MKRTHLSILIASTLLLGAAAQQSPNPSPSPRKTEQRNCQRESVDPDSKSDDPIAAPIPPQRASEAPNQQKQSGEITANNNKEPISVVVASAVDVRKDWVDRSFALFSFLLVVVGGFQIALLWQIRGETRTSERAWVAFKLEKVEGLDKIFEYRDNPAVLDQQIIYVLLGFRYSTINSGKTVARVTNASINAACATAEALVNLPAEPVYPKATAPYAPFLLVPNRHDLYKGLLALDRDNVRSCWLARSA